MTWVCPLHEKIKNTPKILKFIKDTKKQLLFPGYKLQVQYYKLQITSPKLQVKNYKLQITSCKLPIYKLQIANYKFTIYRNYFAS